MQVHRRALKHDGGHNVYGPESRSWVFELSRAKIKMPADSGIYVDVLSRRRSTICSLVPVLDGLGGGERHRRT
jgi:hypothetical protein